MAQFKLCIAGYTAQIDSLFESTPAYLGKYRTENAPDFSIAVTREDLVFEAGELRREAEEEGFRPRVFPDPFLERAAIQRKFAEFLFDRDTLLLHGSTVAVDGVAYLFTAKSGTGKSTHTRLWQQAFGSRAVMVNDDKPFLKLCAAGVLACGSPWSGKHGLDANVALPLGGICLLERGAANEIQPADPESLLPFLRHQSCRPLDAGKESKFLALTEALARAVPLWHMRCNKEPEAAYTAFAAMRQE